MKRLHTGLIVAWFLAVGPQPRAATPGSIEVQTAALIPATLSGQMDF